ncbi:MAG: ThuA domain-containing protein, partial [Saprospiraceae bacterium]|nr:ThuA domain-containing protein [Saprospiraceae bacterium]
LTEYDLLLFYDMYDSITHAQKQAYIDLIETGKPMIFLHHSLVSYQDWPEFRAIVGGKYHTLDSTRLSHYKHDESISVKVEDPQHPITYGMSDFTIEDETYGNCEILPGVTPLLRTDHPLSMPVIGWVNHYRQHPIVYLQGGHGPTAYRDPHFQKILKNAIHWSLRKENAN